MFKHGYVLMAEEGEGSTGGSAVDRGDNLEDTLTPSDKSEDTSDEDLKEVLKDDEADEKPRDASGKFTKKDKEGEPSVPKHRFDEAIAKEREAREAAERRAQELAAKVKQEERNVDVEKLETEIEKLEKDHARLLLDGEHEKAAAVMKQIRHGERLIAKLESDEKTTRATQQAVEQVRMDAAIASLEATYPALNQDSESYDQDLVDLVLAEQRRLIQVEGVSPAAALTKAGSKIMKKFAPAEDAPAKKGLEAAKNGEDRKSKQVEKNLDTDRRQPPSMKDSGIDSDKAGVKGDKIDVTKLSREEFAALPAATRERLRGDMVA
jgi:hypothetical protein